MTCNNPERFHFPGNIQWFVNSAHMYCTAHVKSWWRKNVAFELWWKRLAVCTCTLESLLDEPSKYKIAVS